MGENNQEKILEAYDKLHPYDPVRNKYKSFLPIEEQKAYWATFSKETGETKIHEL